jgi:hypothetical protein
MISVRVTVHIVADRATGLCPKIEAVIHDIDSVANHVALGIDGFNKQLVKDGKREEQISLLRKDKIKTPGNPVTTHKYFIAGPPDSVVKFIGVCVPILSEYSGK